jgi:hypothetical protein
LNQEDNDEHDGERQVGNGWCRFAKRLPGDEDEDSADKEDAAEAFEEVPENLLRVVGWRFRWDVAAIFCDTTLSLAGREAIRDGGGQTRGDFVGGDFVPV